MHGVCLLCYDIYSVVVGNRSTVDGSEKKARIGPPKTRRRPISVCVGVSPASERTNLVSLASSGYHLQGEITEETSESELVYTHAYT